MHKLALLLRRQGGQDFFLHPGHIALDMGQSLHALRRDHQQLAPAVRRIRLAHHPTLGLKPPNDRARSGRVKGHAFGQAHLVNARAAQQGVQDGELHGRDVSAGQLLGKNGHSYLLGPSNQVTRRGLQVDALDHVRVVFRCSARLWQVPTFRHCV